MIERCDYRPPARLSQPGVFSSVGYMLFVVFLIWSIEKVGMSPRELARGIPNMMRLLGEMSPPDFSRIGFVMKAILMTFQMALVGAVIGILLSFFLSVLAARNLSPHPIIYHAVRLLIALFRTVPDLVWAIFFVATVGLGSFAGTLTIVVDTMGFCGRFFAEAMEEVDPGSQEALSAIGATRAGIVFSAVLPAALPSFINSSLFSLEKAVRSSVVLGLVGAGGIGIELKVAMDMFMFREAATIILCVFVLVLAVEQLSGAIRSRFIYG